MLKVKSLGITGIVFDWIKSGYRMRTKSSAVRSSSEWTNVISGVPQGSILGPLSLLIYINYIDDTVASNALNFGDDTNFTGINANQ
jgi:ribonuclease P/MRP protein subunit RPP40